MWRDALLGPSGGFICSVGFTNRAGVLHLQPLLDAARVEVMPTFQLPKGVLVLVFLLQQAYADENKLTKPGIQCNEIVGNYDTT